MGEKGTSERSPFNQVFRIRAVHFLAFFILVYVGVEVSIGGAFSCPFTSMALMAWLFRLDRHFYA